MLFFQGEIKWHGLHHKQLIYVLVLKLPVTSLTVNFLLINKMQTKPGSSGFLVLKHY